MEGTQITIDQDEVKNNLEEIDGVKNVLICSNFIQTLF